MATVPAPAPPPASGTPPAKNARPLWSYIAVFILFLVSVLMQFFAENGEQIAEQWQSPPLVRRVARTTGRFFDSRFAYLPRPTEAHYVALISISQESEGTLPDACAVRSFIAGLLPHLAAVGPAMIVSDITAPGDDATNVCPAGAPASLKLIEAITTVAKTTPLVLGQASYTLSELPTQRRTQLEEEGFAETDLLLRKPLHFDPQPPNVAFGLIRLNQNVDRVPIVWFGHDTPTSGARPVPTIGLAAAKMYRSGFPEGDHRLKELESRLYHPIFELLPESAFSVVPAIRLMCSSEADKPNWHNCTPPAQVTPELMNQLHGRIVVIGFSDNPDDQWKTKIGQVPGYVLHANDIEVLLDARAYRPLGFLATCGLSLVWLLIVELPFGFLDLPIWKAVALVIGVSFVVLFLAKYVALVNFGLYISPFPPSLLLVAVSAVHLIARRFES